MLLILMMAAKLKQKILQLNSNNEDGQAIFEFIMFLPLMLIMYSITLSMGGAINGSINQQKIARGYFYSRIKNNSTFPQPGNVQPSWRKFGMHFIGWKVKFDGGGDGEGDGADSGEPLAPCYKILIPMPNLSQNSAEDECNESGNPSNPTTQFVRVKTVYGVCGATYSAQNNNVFRDPQNAGVDGCTIR